MGGWFWIFIVLGICCTSISRAKADGSNYYTAGVVEFRPAVSGGNSSQLLEENLLAYLEIIKEANGTTDIIVFPEASLNTQLQLTAVPAANPEQSLCNVNKYDDEVAPFLRELACAARDANTYLVVNVKERETCPSQSSTCPSRGYLVFNTNVVFDRRGAIVSRYRKWNLYLEPYTNRTSEPEYATFETDFNVTFGHFICFDMLFYEPAQELVERLGIHDIIVTKMFNSELPFLTATQLQQGWAWGNNVNLLASGASLPTSGITGSGIYAGKHGALARLMVGNQTEGQRKLLVAQVPIWSAEGDPIVDLDTVDHPVQSVLPLLQQPAMRHYGSVLLPLNTGGTSIFSGWFRVQDLECEYNITMLPVGEGPAPYHYRFSGLVDTRTYEEAQYNMIRICGLCACLNESATSCGILNDETDRELVEFASIRIAAKFPQRHRRLLMPNSLTDSLYALQPNEMTWLMEERNGSTWTEINLTRPHKHLLAFGIYGNYFDEYKQEEDEDDDDDDDGKGTGVIKRFSLSLGFIILLIMLIR